MTFKNLQKIVGVGETWFLPYAPQAAQEESEVNLNIQILITVENVMC
jgi:hypothetical protein